jgi:hypothetical protein
MPKFSYVLIKPKKIMTKTIIFLMTLLLSLNLSAQTPEAMTAIDEELVPVKVVEQINQMNPGQEVEQWYVFDDLYSAKMTVDEMPKYQRFNSEGLMIEERFLKDWDSAPERLKKGKQKTTYKYWDVTEFYEIHQEGQLSHYFLMLQDDSGDTKSMYFDADGKLSSKSNSNY